jgi:DNA helicase-2/ATP-dependent DNA helicase PcrA
MEVIQVPESYRCPPPVVVLANNLIKHNIERSPDKEPLVSAVDPEHAEEVRVEKFADQQQEMAWVANDIATQRVDPGQCTVLARNGKLLRAAADALREAGLSPYLVIHKNEFESGLLRFVHSSLRLANAPRDHEQLERLCTAFFHLTGIEVRPEDADVEGELQGGSLLRGFVAVGETTVEEDSQPAALLCRLREQLLERLNHRDFVRETLEQFAGAMTPDADEEAAEVQVWNDLERQVRQQFGDAPTLNQFLHELDLRQKTSPPRKGDVQCLTIHLAKGKEFEYVYLVGLAEDQLPSYFAKQKGDNSRELEEERRNCFVAITRVQSTLTLTYASSYSGWAKQPSRFLSEMGVIGLGREAGGL